jgi:hypothetical protein
MAVILVGVAGCGDHSLPPTSPDLALPCGALGESCCATSTPCMGDATCQKGTCAAKKNTGEPCAADADCLGVNAKCILVDSKGTTWPDGYCTSDCDPGKDQQGDRSDAECPGGAGTCIIVPPNTFRCERNCTAKSGMNPCTRAGYTCFFGCEPTSLSQCNPTKRGDCGAMGSCFRTGRDDVGSCMPACDPFQQTCGQGMGCYPSGENGESSCFMTLNNQNDGDSCLYINGCNPGLVCYKAAGCHPFCGGPNNVACTNQHSCVDFTATVPASEIGVCDG